MRKVILIFSILVCAVVSVSAQKKKDPKNWRIIVYGKTIWTKGSLQNVTDSSVVILFPDKKTREINFNLLRKIKLRPRHYSGVAIGAASFFVEGIAGGIIIGNAMSKGKTGEPAAMSGVVGGIGGGILAGITSAIVNPLLVEKLVSKKIYVHHDPASYDALKIRLKPFCLNQ
jgi:hypothetical protein